MGRKKKPPESSPKYGTLIVSSLLHSVEFFVSPSQEPPPESAEKLENDLAFLFEPPEIKELLRMTVIRLKELAPDQWEKIALNICKDWAQRISTLWWGLGLSDKQIRVPLKKVASRLLSDFWGLQGSFKKQAADWKSLFIDIFEKIIAGELGPAFWSQELTGTFRDDPARALALIRLMFQLESDALILKVDEAVKILRDKLLTSPELKAAAAFAEKQYKLGKDNADQRFKDLWTERRSRIMGVIIRLDLKIPDAYEVDSMNRKTWSEEEELAIGLVFEELKERAFRNPFRLIQDAIDGTLANFLVKTIVHDFLDGIRYGKADKRGFHKLDRSEDVHNEDSKKISAGLARVSPKEPLDELTDKEDWDERTKRLTETEKSILDMIVQKYSQEEIARKFGKNRPWVREQLEVIQKKIRPPDSS